MDGRTNGWMDGGDKQNTMCNLNTTISFVAQEIKSSESGAAMKLKLFTFSAMELFCSHSGRSSWVQMQLHHYTIIIAEVYTFTRMSNVNF